MKNEIEQMIRLDKQELEKQADLDPFRPQRLLSRLQARNSRQAPAARKLAWAAAYGLAVALLAFIQLQWLPPGPEFKSPSATSVIKLTPFPPELQNTIYRSFSEVVQWEK